MGNNNSAARGKAPGVNSIMWDTLTDLANLPLLPPIAIMQSGLPAVGTAVNRYGVYKSDPQGRGRRTNWSMIRFLYDGGDFARNEARDLRALHANIKGTLDDGSKYFALHPKTFRIVPDTFLDGVIRIREDVGRPLTSAQKAKLYHEEYVPLCELLGIPAKDIEPDLKSFYEYYEDLILNTMTYNDTVKYLTTRSIELPARFKYFKSAQPYADAAYKRWAYPAMKVSVIGALHPLYRERFDLPWSDHDKARYKKLCGRLNRYAKLVPRPLRYNPAALGVMLGMHGPNLVTMEELERIEVKKAEYEANKKLRAEQPAAR
ncbi:oxygenase MpaB family protein [Ketobacter nezhaii]|uniref:oxygenase MpaB family protein n=1 Tax=Ketobacter sp. MCCC 1A13808 TaxID=2602738 RepID=UPI0018DD2C45|nr:oxygenase MpaB family protein [Ketobacter sp. MCCC 1A13808]